MWNLTKVTVKEKSIKKELENLCRVSHPGILLLMAVCQDQDDQDDLGLQLVFQHVPLGSLHHWLHVQVITNTFVLDPPRDAFHTRENVLHNNIYINMITN